MSLTHNLQSSMEQSSIFNGRYEKETLLGQGSFGKVWLAVDTTSGEEVAIKVVDKVSLNSEDKATHLKDEEEVCKAIAEYIRHRNIVDIYKVESTSSEIYIIMKYVKGCELLQKIKEEGRLAEDTARKWFQQIIEGVNHIHKNNIIHRDLKPENVLIDEFDVACICDFGFGKIVEPSDKLQKYCGSPVYTAPEILSGMPYSGPATDMWSCGIMLFTMLTGNLPFYSSRISELFRKIKVSLPSIPRYVSPLAGHLLSQLLTKDPLSRISTEDCLNHPWLTRGCLDSDTLPIIRPKNILLVNPTTKPTLISSTAVEIDRLRIADEKPRSFTAKDVSKTFSTCKLSGDRNKDTSAHILNYKHDSTLHTSSATDSVSNTYTIKTYIASNESNKLLQPLKLSDKKKVSFTYNAFFSSIKKEEAIPFWQ
ncbi:kinase-like domain-containing protein [Spinellus fusiger]|nr:kinase-like domain-containing protein [Spinellus fusiger]